MLAKDLASICLNSDEFSLESEQSQQMSIIDQREKLQSWEIRQINSISQKRSVGLKAENHGRMSEEVLIKRRKSAMQHEGKATWTLQRALQK